MPCAAHLASTARPEGEGFLAVVALATTARLLREARAGATARFCKTHGQRPVHRSSALGVNLAPRRSRLLVRPDAIGAAAQLGARHALSTRRRRLPTCRPPMSIAIPAGKEPLRRCGLLASGGAARRARRRLEVSAKVLWSARDSCLDGCTAAGVEPTPWCETAPSQTCGNAQCRRIRSRRRASRSELHARTAMAPLALLALLAAAVACAPAAAAQPGAPSAYNTTSQR